VSTAQQRTMEYEEYIASAAWRKKRQERLVISKFKCAACGSGQNLDVHHLTYARFLNEDMADLLPLCRTHHDAVEDLVAKGLLPRSDNVLYLATETIRLLNPVYSSEVVTAIDLKRTARKERKRLRRLRRKEAKEIKESGYAPLYSATVPFQHEAPRKKYMHGVKVNNPGQEQLMTLRWFVEALTDKRDVFKKRLHDQLIGERNTASVMANAFALYDRAVTLRLKYNGGVTNPF